MTIFSKSTGTQERNKLPVEKNRTSPNNNDNFAGDSEQQNLKLGETSDNEELLAAAQPTGIISYHVSPTEKAQLSIK